MKNHPIFGKVPSESELNIYKLKLEERFKMRELSDDVLNHINIDEFIKHRKKILKIICQ